MAPKGLNKLQGLEDLNWSVKDRIRSHEAYLRGTRSLASTLNWATGESGIPTPSEEKEDAHPAHQPLPDSLSDDPQDHDAAVDHSDGTQPHDTSAGFSVATNWDAVLDTAGIPTDGTPPDPLAAQQHQEQIEDMAARQAMSRDTGSQPGITSPLQQLSPASPGAQEKAKQRQRAGRGVEGCGDEPVNDPMGSGNLNWDSIHNPKL